MYAVCVHNCGGQKWASDSSGKELKAVVSYLTREEMGSKLESSERAESVLNHWASLQLLSWLFECNQLNISCFGYKYKEEDTAWG